MLYSTQLFSPTHPANQPHLAPRCCLDAHSARDYILCATCPQREPRQLSEDDWHEQLLEPEE